VVRLHLVVSEPIGVRQRIWKDVVDRSEERLCLVGHHLHRSSMIGQGSVEEPAGRLGVAPARDVDVDDLAC